jgi:hypothetical protein
LVAELHPLLESSNACPLKNGTHGMLLGRCLALHKLKNFASYNFIIGVFRRCELADVKVVGEHRYWFTHATIKGIVLSHNL